ncbi:isocitrate lyase/PEP mutase family protein [Alkalimonas sp.]|uniref:isocitrate lyase/PEP mutase family protein n=1 Tax=Alkalimonas sp. TaxID=1872453 RepID=UPI00263AA02A|nr:isocitrate lyase/PEP mutase family protein [Alkalimonas sp.]MCC5825009.1 isocitrate lyase/PEP mutase family protein [Alkalimonas sp.]
MTTVSLKQQLRAGNTLSLPGVYDGLSAQLVAQAGFSAAFVSGACVAFSRLGKPDLGLVSLSELAQCVAQIREAVDLPLLVDMDTGFGNALNTQRAVRLLERSGASALQIEDQQMPKRCGHMRGKQVISCQEMVGKLKAALDARQQHDTLIVARTDALGVTGFDDALERAEHYLATGVDALFIEAPHSIEQMQRISAQFAGRIPLVHNLVEGGNSPVHSRQQLAALGYQIALFPASLLNRFIPQAQQLLKHLAEQGETKSLADSMTDLHGINAVLSADSILADISHYREETL